MHSVCDFLVIIIYCKSYLPVSILSFDLDDGGAQGHALINCSLIFGLLPSWILEVPLHQHSDCGCVLSVWCAIVSHVYTQLQHTEPGHAKGHSECTAPISSKV